MVLSRFSSSLLKDNELNGCKSGLRTSCYVSAKVFEPESSSASKWDEHSECLPDRIDLEMGHLAGLGVRQFALAAAMQTGERGSLNLAASTLEAATWWSGCVAFWLNLGMTSGEDSLMKEQSWQTKPLGVMAPWWALPVADGRRRVSGWEAEPTIACQEWTSGPNFHLIESIELSAPNWLEPNDNKPFLSIHSNSNSNFSPIHLANAPLHSSDFFHLDQPKLGQLSEQRLSDSLINSPDTMPPDRLA